MHCFYHQIHFFFYSWKKTRNNKKRGANYRFIQTVHVSNVIYKEVHNKNTPKSRLEVPGNGPAVAVFIPRGRLGGSPHADPACRLEAVLFIFSCRQKSAPVLQLSVAFQPRGASPEHCQPRAIISQREWLSSHVILESLVILALSPRLQNKRGAPLI